MGELYYDRDRFGGYHYLVMNTRNEAHQLQKYKRGLTYVREGKTNLGECVDGKSPQKLARPCAVAYPSYTCLRLR